MPPKSTLKDLNAADKAKVGELVMRLASEKSQRKELEDRTAKTIAALKREVRSLKKENSKCLKKNEVLVKQLDISLGEEDFPTHSAFDFTRGRNALQRSELNASQFKTIKPRHRTVDRGSAPCQETDWNSASKWPEDFSSSQFRNTPQHRTGSTSPLKGRSSPCLGRSVLTQTVIDEGTQTLKAEIEQTTGLDEIRKERQTKTDSYRSSDGTFGCRTDRKEDLAYTDKSQDTTQDQTCIEIDLEKSPIDEAKSLTQDILSLSMNLRQLKSSTSPLPTSQKESRGAAIPKPLESSRRSPVNLGQPQLDYLKLILEKAHCCPAATKDTLGDRERCQAAKEVHCRGCCYGAEVIVTSKRNPISTPSTCSKSKSPGSFNTSRGRLTSSRLFHTRRDDDAMLSSRSIRSSRNVRGGLYDDNLYRLVGELEHMP
jgi:hypothetical protein